MCGTAVISGKSISLDENDPDATCYDAEIHGCWTELFRHMEDSPGMVAEMAELPGDYDVPEGFTVEPVEDHAGLRRYFEVWALGYSYPPHIVEPFVKLYGEIGFDDGRPDRLYLGCLDGDPVATSMVMRVGETASVWWVAVLSEVRQQGLGVLMTLEPLLMEKERGCRLAALFSSSVGFPLYQRLGFREQTKLSYYVWLNEAPLGE